ncbi:MAG: S9 family peptidase [Candidatus Marinimicrobia bacterium]|nr:S9 family peptidase [Candidatus Neomarinimicrobiota bacterium]
MALLSVFLFQTCDQPESKTEHGVAGDLIAATQIQEYSSADIQVILQGIGLENPGNAVNSLRAVKLNYLSPDLDGELRSLSGALIYPLDETTHPLLNIGHGTVTKRGEVASVNPMNSSAGMSALLTASQGYVTLVPDFAGFGDSRELHPYLHAESLVNATIDMIRAAEVYCAENSILLNEQLFLTGYSEGGYACLATQRTLETEFSDEFVLTASAPMAGPYDLYEIATVVLSEESALWPAYIGFLLVAYDEIYEFNNLGNVFQAPYDEQVKHYYDGSSSFFEINGQLPQSMTDLISPDFRLSYLDGTETDYTSAFKENSLLDWSPITPARLYHGMADETVPYVIAEITAENLRANGATDLELVGIPGANHSTAGIPALLAMLEWFSSFQGDDANLVNQIK